MPDSTASRRIAIGSFALVLLALVLAGAHDALRGATQVPASRTTASDLRLRAEWRDRDGAEWSDVLVEHQFAVRDMNHFRMEETHLYQLEPNEPRRTVYMLRDTESVVSRYDVSDRLLDQQHFAWNTPLPDLLEANARNDLGTTAMPTVMGQLRAYGHPVVDPVAVDQLVRQGELTVVGSDVLLGLSTRIMEAHDYTAGIDSIARVWLTEDGIKLRTQYYFKNEPNNQVEVTALTRDAGVKPQELEEPLDEQRLHSDAGSRPFDLAAIVHDHPGTGLVFEGDLRNVANPARIAEPAGFTIDPPVFITATVPLGDPRFPDDRRSGWIVAHELRGPSSQYVLVLQALAGNRLPLGLSQYWPEDLDWDLEDGGVGENAQYLSKDAVMIGDRYLAQLYHAVAPGEDKSWRPTLQFQYLLTTELGVTVRCVFLGNKMTREELLAVAAGFLRASDTGQWQ